MSSPMNTTRRRCHQLALKLSTVTSSEVPKLSLKSMNVGIPPSSVLESLHGDCGRISFKRQSSGCLPTKAAAERGFDLQPVLADHWQMVEKISLGHRWYLGVGTLCSDQPHVNRLPRGRPRRLTRREVLSLPVFICKSGVPCSKSYRRRQQE